MKLAHIFRQPVSKKFVFLVNDAALLRVPILPEKSNILTCSVFDVNF